MVLGFVGTLVALERAVALGARWALAAPGCSGFVMSMVFVPAPVILPAVLRRPLPYRPVLYAPLALLHASLLVRVVIGDGVTAGHWTWPEAVWRWAGVGNVAAVRS